MIISHRSMRRASAAWLSRRAAAVLSTLLCGASLAGDTLLLNDHIAITLEGGGRYALQEQRIPLAHDSKLVIPVGRGECRVTLASLGGERGTLVVAVAIPADIAAGSAGIASSMEAEFTVGGVGEAHDDGGRGEALFAYSIARR